MSKKIKLELTWIGKDKRPRLEPRILLEDPELSYAAENRVSENDIFDNILIHGDNLLALKALEQDFSGKVKCIFIDPPYNTGSAFEQYDDGLEHSIWLSLMRHRLDLLRSLLSSDGSIWITIDDHEVHYLKIVCDEVFGRDNFVANLVWEKKYAPANDALWFSDNHDHILVYAKDKQSWRPNRLPRTEEQNKHYKNPDNDPRGRWMSDNYTCAKSAKERPNLYYPIINPHTKEEIWPKKTRVWAFSHETHQEHVSENRIYWGKNGTNSTPRLKKFLADLRQKGRVSTTIWPYSEVGHTQDAKREQKALSGLLAGALFATPKPERLLHRVITLATDEGDLVLDSFLGSGTTAAVAHKMRRRWIGIELGRHAMTHCQPRMTAIIKNQDSGGVTEVTDWSGGGGFRFYRLAPSLLEEDKWGNWVINRAYNKEMLAEAMCKLEGFQYDPSSTIFWMHGQSTETDYIYVTTQTLTHEQLQVINAEVGDDRTLLICCSAFRARLEQFPNLTVKKIPASVLSRCEWGKDDYSLNVQTVMGEEPEEFEPESDELLNDSPKRKQNNEGRKHKMQELPLFATIIEGDDK
ncbi:site-specific DNA-methyltransferase [Lujinxingia vulgaris]|uniref:Site-specific DNA-methyltransferase n=1 Tax=Lujinxingia vulgaris TaxID=2600176 RepID=A0A5C6X1V6_9DELT|nr:site-specific DNA-methyltransferase [Lujinxingia vulgaris]TXD34241.1 site-specific DNA-methyltransferase [Lujinxingia vulgaris]